MLRACVVVALMLVTALPHANPLRQGLVERLLYEEPYEQLEALGKASQVLDSEAAKPLQISDTEGALERTFLSKAHREAALLIQQIMVDAGLVAHIDAVRNVRGKLAGRRLNLPVLLSGSHYDTVKDAGRFDGMLGVIVPIAAIKALLTQAAVDASKLDEEALATLGHISLAKLLTAEEIAQLIQSPVEIIAFCDEEGIRFQTTFLGSRAIAGDLVGSHLLDAEDADGITIRQSLEINPESEATLSALAYTPASVRGYVEVHMEQGPVLEARGWPLGLVAGIAGQTRLLITLSGTQGHAGTVPMEMRKDPMAAAAEIITWVERRCGGGKYGSSGGQAVANPSDALMCTTGSITLWPNAFNVIPGSANFTLDIRSRNDDVWQGVTAEAIGKVEAVCERRGLVCTASQKTAVPAVHSDPDLMGDLRDAMSATQKDSVFGSRFDPGCASFDSSEASPDQMCTNPDASANWAEDLLLTDHEPISLVSGAGHDALAMAQLTKMAMLFVRCRGGHSHSPLEHVSQRDVAAAAATMYNFFRQQLL